MFRLALFVIFASSAALAFQACLPIRKAHKVSELELGQFSLRDENEPFHCLASDDHLHHLPHTHNIVLPMTHNHTLTYQQQQQTSSILPRSVIMSDEETDAILQTIQDCSEHSQCNVDDVSSLLQELKQQEREMEARLATMEQLTQQLRTLNQKPQRQVDEIRAFVQDMLRVFAHGGQAFSPTGFAGDIGDGPKTAYDALPPKKWKPSHN